ncbi:MAG: hypothetical protein JOZ55_07885 [Alphaproteobacteria bacterium]|nr:hypothetical protein [Alphaproteobacteria bacterium]
MWNVIRGRLAITIGTETDIAGPGMVAVVPPKALRSVMALTDGRAIVVDSPVRKFLAAKTLSQRTPRTSVQRKLSRAN